SFTGSLTYAAEDRAAAVPLLHVVDELHDHDRLPYPRTAEKADLAALHEGRDQIDDLDTGLEDLGLGLEFRELGSLAVNRLPLRIGGNRRPAVYRLAEHVEDAPQRSIADRRRDRRAGIRHLHATGDAVGGTHRHRPHLILPDVLLHL